MVSPVGGHFSALPTMQIVRVAFPLAGLFFLMLGCTVALDAVLHLIGQPGWGRYLGYVGTLLLLVSFAYSLRKRKHIKIGRPLLYLRAHEVLAWLGALLVLVHGGIHFNAVLPWLAAGAMVVAVASGLTGKYLLAQARILVAARREELLGQELSPDRVAEELHLDALMVELMKKWRAVHMPVTTVFLWLALLHIGSILLFWRW